MQQAGKRYYRGEIYYINRSDKNDSIESEIKPGRPAIIVSNDLNNEFSPNVEVVYLTTKPKGNLPTHVEIVTSKQKSYALCEGVDTISKSRIGSYINQIGIAELKKINDALAVSLGLGNEIKNKETVEEWVKHIKEFKDDIESDDVLANIKTLDIDTDKIKEILVEALKEYDMQKNALSEVSEPDNSKDVIYNNPEYIKVCTERDMLKNLYYELLEKYKGI